ncbi:MAG: sugar phosphate isomerase/epimerase family protein [Kiritimatiellia bacterium]
MNSGLVSITFRQLSCEDIINLVKQAGLQGIEWGGDVHVPHGNTARAAEVRKLTRDAGLSVSSYGSYYRSGEQNDFSFEDVLKTAGELSAPTIRVWAGRKGSEAADEAYREAVVKDLRECAETASRENIVLALEYHGNTLTDTNESAARLVKEVSHSNLRLYWQTPGGTSFEYRKTGLEAALPVLSNLHVFNWKHEDGKLVRLPLDQGEEEWMSYLSLAQTAEGDRWALIEFVTDNDPGNFLRDAATLNKWLERLEQ